MLTTIIIVLLVLWLFGAYAPVNNGRAFIGGGPYLGGGVGLILAIVVVVLLLNHGVL